MFHKLPEKYIYSAYKIEAFFEDNLCTQKSGQGTAFVVGIDSENLAIVTNRHVVDIDYKQPTNKYKDFSLKSLVVTGRRDDDSLYRFEIEITSPIHYSQRLLDDVAVFISPRCKALENMQEMKVFYHFSIDDLADEEFLKSQLSPFDVVAFAGFPEEHDRLSERPLVRSGRIASDPKFDFSIGAKDQGRCIAYEAFSHGGASGSPVFAAAIVGSRDGKLVGVNAGHVKTEPEGHHTGLSYFYRSSIILEIINGNGIPRA